MPAYRLKPGDRAVIHRKVAAMHVSASVRDVLRPLYQAARRLWDRPGLVGRLWRRRSVRRTVYREALRQHEKNRALYRRVLSGG